MNRFWSRGSPSKGDDSNDCTTATDVTGSMEDSVAPNVVEQDQQIATGFLLYNAQKPNATLNGNLVNHAEDDVKNSDISASDDQCQKDEQCGWGPFQPRWCQIFRNAKVVLLILCIVATVQVCSKENFCASCIVLAFHRSSHWHCVCETFCLLVCLLLQSYSYTGLAN
jgi:hypothetical protein